MLHVFRTCWRLVYGLLTSGKLFSSVNDSKCRKCHDVHLLHPALNALYLCLFRTQELLSLQVRTRLGIAGVELITKSEVLREPLVTVAPDLECQR